VSGFILSGFTLSRFTVSGLRHARLVHFNHNKIRKFLSNSVVRCVIASIN
jgi:hypothetical protein